MLIRSQDKTKLISLKSSYSVYIVGNEVHICGDNYGEYATREKAIKVLDMICNRYQAIWDVENGYITGGGINFGSVFQMPQDSEV